MLVWDIGQRLRVMDARARRRNAPREMGRRGGFQKTGKWKTIFESVYKAAEADIKPHWRTSLVRKHLLSNYAERLEDFNVATLEKAHPGCAGGAVPTVEYEKPEDSAIVQKD